MKLYQLSSINEAQSPNRIMGAELVFVASICPLTGKLREPVRQPDEWDNVKRLTNMLFLAWDNANPVEGTVYLGDLRGSSGEQ